MTSDGKPFSQERYKQIVKERFIISKNTHITYSDTENITPLERGYLIQFIVDDLQKTKDMMEQAQLNRKKG